MIGIPQESVCDGNRLEGNRIKIIFTCPFYLTIIIFRNNPNNLMPPPFQQPFQEAYA